MSPRRWRHPHGRPRRAVLGKAPASTLSSPRARRTPRAFCGILNVMGTGRAAPVAAASAPLTHARRADRLAPCFGYAGERYGLDNLGCRAPTCTASNRPGHGLSSHIITKVRTVRCAERCKQNFIYITTWSCRICLHSLSIHLHSGRWGRTLMVRNVIHITTSRTEHLIAYPQHSIGPLQAAAAPIDRLLFGFWTAGPFGGREPGPILLTYLDGGGRSTPSLLDTVVVIGRHERQGQKAFV